jgi:hypothetical protein
MVLVSRLAIKAAQTCDFCPENCGFSSVVAPRSGTFNSPKNGLPFRSVRNRLPDKKRQGATPFGIAPAEQRRSCQQKPSAFSFPVLLSRQAWS